MAAYTYVPFFGTSELAAEQFRHVCLCASDGRGSSHPSPTHTARRPCALRRSMLQSRRLGSAFNLSTVHTTRIPDSVVSIGIQMRWRVLTLLVRRLGLATLHPFHPHTYDGNSTTSSLKFLIFGSTDPA